MKIVKFIASTLFTASIAIVAAWGFYNFAPIDIFHVPQAIKPGSAFTNLVGSNVISNFPTTYNANLGITANTSAANTFIGLQTLSTGLLSQASSTVVGNFTSTGAASLGSLTLGSPLGAAYGGTSSTTLSQYAVLIGNLTGDFLTPTNGLGSNGQFLTSGGAGVAPSWTTSAINQAISYTWTGQHTFSNAVVSSGTTTIACSGSSNWLKLNGVQYVCPSSQATYADSVLGNDGSGNLSWLSPVYLYANGAMLSTTNNSTTTLLSLTIPAGVLSSANGIVVTTIGTSTEPSGSTWEVDLGTGSATDTVAIFSYTNPTVILSRSMLMNLTNSSQFIWSESSSNQTAGTGAAETWNAFPRTGAISTTGTLTMNFNAHCTNEGKTCGFIGVYIQLLSH